MLSAPPRTQTNRTRRSLEDAMPARTLNNPPPPRFPPNLDDREIQLLLKHDLPWRQSEEHVPNGWQLGTGESRSCQGKLDFLRRERNIMAEIQKEPVLKAERL